MNHEVRAILDTLPALVSRARSDGSVDFANRGWLEFCGLTEEEVLDFKWTSLLHPDDERTFLDMFTSAVPAQKPITTTARFKRADGEYRLLQVHSIPLLDGSHEVTGWYAVAYDIEELSRLKDQLQKENIALKKEVTQASMFEDIVGSSQSLRRVLADVAKVAATDSTVLVTGETGTGKELIARAIHKRSRRGNRPFVSVNCGAIPTSLISSELFGHEKGAFTGALQRHLGRFEMADGGTIFLDEIGELPPETQVTLLRVLQERAFERVGGTRPIPVDVRVIAATNRDLEKAIDDGGFREELFYRLNVFPLHLPPLRERPGDIALLVEYFTDRYAAKMGKKITKVSKSTMDLFRSYAWPGNVRELQNVIERGVILADGDTLVVDPSWLQRPAARVNITRGLGRPSLKEEKQMIEAALANARGRVAGPEGAAAKLGIPRSTLESRIRSLRISKNRFRAE